MAKKSAAPVAKGGKTDFRKQLAGANKLWASAKKRAAESKSGESEFRDGRYLMRCTGGEITTSNAGRLQAVFKWRFEEEPYEGKVKNNYQGLETEDNLMFLARDLERLGYEAPDDLAGIEEILKDLGKEKPLARIRLKTKENSDFQNLYIDKVLSGDEDGEDDEDTEDEAEVEEGDTEEEGGDEEEADEEESDEEEEADEEEEGEAEEDLLEIEVGMTVDAETSKGTRTGKIIEILEDEDMVRVKMDDNGKVVKLTADKVTLSTPAEPEAAPKAKAKAKKGKK